MKKTIVLTLIFAILCTFATPVFAIEKNDVPAFLQEIDMSCVTDIEYYEDGRVAVTTLEILAESRATNTKTGKKTRTVYDANGAIDFSVTNTSTFTYTGSSSSCTSVSASKSVPDSSWTVTTSTIISGRTGHVYYSAKQYVSGIVVNTKTDYVSITCSSTGVLS
ncbi:MAG: hypothetical protein IKB13_02765 [Clostridia bacterium]|nr:hypothetical protein [Clostridia bacterium]